MSKIFISSQNSTTGLNLFAPTSNTNVANQLKDIINANSLSGDDVSDVIISTPAPDTTINLTSIGKIDLNNDTANDSSLWRIRNGSNTTRNFNLFGFGTTFNVNYNALLAKYDSYVVSPIVDGTDGAATHILTDTIANSSDTKAALNQTALGPSLSITTDRYNITGTSFNDTLTGANADDTLNGGLGADVLTGGLGGDTINLGIDAVSDSVFYNPATILDAGSKADTINNFVPGTDKIVLGGGLELVSNGGTVNVLSLGPVTLIDNSGDIFAVVLGVSLVPGDVIIVP